MVNTLFFAVIAIVGCFFAIVYARRLDVWFKRKRTPSAGVFFVAATSAILYAIGLLVDAGFTQQFAYSTNPAFLAIPVGMAIYAVMVITGPRPSEDA
jgi:hypothetical protein